MMRRPIYLHTDRFCVETYFRFRTIHARDLPCEKFCGFDRVVALAYMDRGRLSPQSRPLFPDRWFVQTSMGPVPSICSGPSQLKIPRRTFITKRSKFERGRWCRYRAYDTEGCIFLSYRGYSSTQAPTT